MYWTFSSMVLTRNSLSIDNANLFVLGFLFNKLHQSIDQPKNHFKPFQSFFFFIFDLELYYRSIHSFWAFFFNKLIINSILFVIFFCSFFVKNLFVNLTYFGSFCLEDHFYRSYLVFDILDKRTSIAFLLISHKIISSL
jgi:hypothetical protein